jgi:hypothetical protein
MSNVKKSSIFEKITEATTAYLDSQIMKSKTTILNSNIEDDFFYAKAVIEDPSYSLHSQGWKDKPYRIQNSHLKMMSYQDTAIAGVIQTRQNQVAQHSRKVTSKIEKGWMIMLRDEDAMLAKIKEELQAEMEVDSMVGGEDNPAQEAADVQKAEGDEGEDASSINSASDTSMEDVDDDSSDDNDKSDDEVESYNFELERKAREKLNKKFESAKKAVEEYVINCGKLENRPFETTKWTFDGALRAWVRDSLTYDLYATEIVPDKAGRPHHWFPIDGGSVKQASKDLRKYKDMAANFYNIDILYPERTEEAQERQKAIDLDPKLLEQDAYKWVQVVRGKVERAYTADELKVGIRNINTDIYNNGYGISELELLVAMVSGHLNAEFYNQAYFTQGFSAKGILHIKAAINRRKLETVRQQWQHMLKGSRNSFQTPIFAGVEDVNWIPLTQNHNDIGFEGWMRYIITMIGCIFQIDPAEMGIHFKAEGGGGSMNSKNDTKEKMDNSKDRGLYPLLKHVETHINDNVIKSFDARFILKFTGIDGENAQKALERQKEEVQWKKTVNEIRAEDGLPALPGMDDVLLHPQYIIWYNLYSDKAMKKADQDKKDAADTAQKQMDGQMKMQTAGQPEQPPETPPEQDVYGEGAMHMNNPENVEKSLKPLIVEVYKLKE